jgi:hypothetical protein
LSVMKSAVLANNEMANASQNRPAWPAGTLKQHGQTGAPA